MTRAARGATFDTSTAHQQHQQLQEQLRTMQQDREQLMQGLSDDQLSAVQDRARTMQQLHDSIQNRLQEMDKELSGNNVSQPHVAEEARLAEREMKSYQNEFRKMGDDLGLKND